MRNTRLEQVELYDFDNRFVSHIKPQHAAQYLARKVAEVMTRVGQVIQAIQFLPPAPPPSTSPNSPATITLSDMLANVGLPCTFSDSARGSGHQNYVSRNRIEAAQNKVDAFAVPSWIDRVVKNAQPAYALN